MSLRFPKLNISNFPKTSRFSHSGPRPSCSGSERTHLRPQRPSRKSIPFCCSPGLYPAASICIIVRPPISRTHHFRALVSRLGGSGSPARSVRSCHTEPSISDSSSEPPPSVASEQDQEVEQPQAEFDQYDPYDPYAYAGHNGHSSEDGGLAVNSAYLNP